ncbi:hypothetical protein ACIQ1D_19140 [Lysinibacillus xylanilyticus]|uniref:hypothetical protein n=1 Tax=Lysinibacillus xylanilyticus TaxID=582475 RepID=UPI0037FFF6DA
MKIFFLNFFVSGLMTSIFVWITAKRFYKKGMEDGAELKEHEIHLKLTALMAVSELDKELERMGSEIKNDTAQSK